MEVKEIIPNLNKPITYNGSTYILKASVIQKNDEGELYYQAVIKDPKANSISYVKLEEIK